MLSAPMYAHLAVDSLVRHGLPPAIHLPCAAFQVPWIQGIHGCGVSTPRAADVAAATCGFCSDEHIPILEILTNGITSCIVATGFPSASTVCCDVTVSFPGCEPNEHAIMASATQLLPLISSFLK